MGDGEPRLSPEGAGAMAAVQAGSVLAGRPADVQCWEAARLATKKAAEEPDRGAETGSARRQAGDSGHCLGAC